MNDEGLSLKYILEWYKCAGVDETVGDEPLSLNPKKTQDVLKRALPKVELSAQKVVADNVEFLSSKRDHQDTQNSSFVDIPSATPIDTPSFEDGVDVSSEDPFKDFGSEVALSDDDLPF